MTCILGLARKYLLKAAGPIEIQLLKTDLKNHLTFLNHQFTLTSLMLLISRFLYLFLPLSISALKE